MAGDWVLVSDGGTGRSRDAVAAIRGLAAAGYRPVLGVSPGAMRGPVSRRVARQESLPRATEPGFAAAVEDLIARRGYLTGVAASEAVAQALGLVPERLRDKVALERAAQEAGFDVPKTRVFDGPEALRYAAEELAYPIVVKPATKTFNAFRAGSPADLGARPLPPGRVLAQDAIDGNSTSVVGVASRGELLASVHERWLRTFPVTCGLASAAETIEPDPTIEDGLLKLLAGYDGPFVAQFVGGALIDLNLRVASTHALGEAAGVNVVAIWCDSLRGIRPTVRRARPGVGWRWLEGEVRAAVAEVRGGVAGPVAAAKRLMPRRGTAHSIESITDPGPMFARAITAVGGFIGGRRRAGAS